MSDETYSDGICSHEVFAFHAIYAARDFSILVFDYESGVRLEGEVLLELRTSCTECEYLALGIHQPEVVRHRDNVASSAFSLSLDSLEHIAFRILCYNGVFIFLVRKRSNIDGSDDRIVYDNLQVAFLFYFEYVESRALRACYAVLSFVSSVRAGGIRNLDGVLLLCINVTELDGNLVAYVTVRDENLIAFLSQVETLYACTSGLSHEKVLCLCGDIETISHGDRSIAVDGEDFLVEVGHELETILAFITSSCPSSILCSDGFESLFLFGCNSLSEIP